MGPSDTTWPWKWMPTDTDFLPKAKGFVDVTGEKYGSLTVLFPKGRYPSGGIVWVCVCDCGGKATTSVKKLRSGHTKSCGSCIRKGMNNSFWGGYEELAKEHVSNIREGAVARRINYDITPKYLWELFLSQGRKCALTGVELKLGGANDKTASLDRIDSSRGYVEGNVQWVRKDVNLMKQSYTVQQFTSVCAAVARHSGVEPNIAATQYSLQSKAFEVYISGCLGPHCTNCHNPELWDFSQGRAAAECIDEVQLKVMRAAEMIEQIWLLGGDPLDQSEVGLVLLLERLSSLKPVVLFTRKNIDEVPLRVKELCAYIKTGRYDETLKVEGHKEHGITLSTRNQQVHKMPKSKWNTRTIDKVALDRYLRQSDALYYD